MLYSSYRKQSISNIRNAKFVAFFLVQKTVWFFLQIFTGRSLMVSSFPAQNTVYSSSPRTHSVSNVHRDKFNGLLLLQNTVLFKRSQDKFNGLLLYSYRTQSFSNVHRDKFNGLLLYS